LIAADVGGMQCLGDGLLGSAEDLEARDVVTLGRLEDRLVLAARLYATLDSSHGSVLLRDTAACGRDDRSRTPGCGSSGGGCAYASSPSWSGCGCGWRGPPCTCRKRSSGSAWPRPDAS